jgi:CIC family chloride channel protein
MKGMIHLIKSLSISIGLGLLVSGLALLFNASIEFGAKFVNEIMSSVSITRVMIPLMGGLIMCLIYAYSLKKDATGIGVVQVLVELELVKTHLMKPGRVMIRILGAMLTLIFGFSAGRFGPIVHLGAAVGSNIAYRLRLTEQEIRLLIGCGASAAIAAVFQTPLFAAAFVLEVLYRKQYAQHFTPVLIAALTAYAAGISFYPRVTWQHSTDTSMDAYGAYLILGLVIGILSILYILWINTATSFFKRQRHTYFSILFVALVVGISGYLFPLNFEIHSNTTARIISGEFGRNVLLIIGVMKVLLTGLTLGSGYIGGNFYPAVTIGASFGYLVGITTRSTVPGSFGVLGVGAMVAGYLSAPISGIVLTLELSKSFDFLIPAIMACSISVLLVNHLFGEDVFTRPYKSIMAIKNIGKL